MEPSAKIYAFIKEYEQLHDGDGSRIGLQPKLCPANYWTEGYGKVLKGPDGKMLKYSKKYSTIDSVLPFATIKTECEAEKDFVEDLKKYVAGVNKRLKVKVSQNQFDALVSHAYNCGFSETLYRLINSNAKEIEIRNWFTKKYITAGGEFKKGLQFRRNDEYEIWAGINYKREYKLSFAA